MSRLPELTVATMNEEQKSAYEIIRPGETGPVQGPSSAWMRSPGICERFGWVISYMRHDSAVPARLVELAILISVDHWNSEYPRARHEPLARKAGLGDDVIAALAEGRRPEFSNPDEEALYNFAVELRERHSVGDATYKAALEHLGEQGLVEVVVLLGFYATVAMTVNAFEIPNT